MDAGRPTCSIIPFTNILYFDAIKIEGPQKKILEFNAALKEEGFAGIMDEKDEVQFGRLCEILGKPQFYHSSEVND